MIKSILSAVSILSILFLTGCATPYPVGSLFTQLELPVATTSNPVSSSSKKGTAVCKSYLSWIAVGDASIEAAAKDGGITKITHIDWEVENILGIYGVYTLTVYGE